MSERERVVGITDQTMESSFSSPIDGKPTQADKLGSEPERDDKTNKGSTGEGDDLTLTVVNRGS